MAAVVQASSPAIEVAGLVKRHGDLVAVDGLDLEVESGQVLALLGPNGAGKTTTVETCVGLLRPDAGRVRVLGADPVTDGARLRPRLGVMLQELGVYPQARPREVLRVQAAMFADPLDVDGLLERVGLAASSDTRFRDLSGGQQQRLSLALALVGRPEVAFLDEPTAGLDPAARRATWELVGQLQHDGVAVVLTTHLLDEAEELADDVVIIDRGRVVAAGTPDVLARSDDLVFTTDRPVDLDALAAVVGMEVVRRGRLDHRVAAPPAPDLVARLARGLSDQGVTLTSLNAGRRGLEETFLRITSAPEDRAGARAGARPAAHVVDPGSSATVTARSQGRTGTATPEGD